jgi:AcrR family transcriptional regulator
MDTEGTKERILSAALDLFADHGFHGVSIRSITARVGIKESSLYNHYKHKEDIAGHIYESFINRFLEVSIFWEQEPSETISFDDLQKAVIDSYLSYFSKITKELFCKMWKFLIAEQYHDERAGKILHGTVRDRMLACNIRFLQKLQSLNLIEPDHVEEAAVLLSHYLIACLFDFLNEPNAANRHAVCSRLQQHISVLLRCAKK